MTTLRKGDKGSEVRELQELLNQNGANLTVDGSFGAKTQEAVKAFQGKNGLDRDGVCGPKTWAKLLSTGDTPISIINECVKDIQNLPSFAKFMELIQNE